MTTNNAPQIAHACATRAEDAARWQANQALVDATAIMARATTAATQGDLDTTRRLCQDAYLRLLGGAA